VRCLAKMTAMLLAAALLGPPLMACLVSPEQMSAAEMACCKQMAGDCGAGMSANHPCCQKTVTVHAPALMSVPISVTRHAATAAAAFDLVTTAQPLPADSLVAAGPRHPPPESPPPLAVLRI
jgi:hypothetical protein